MVADLKRLKWSFFSAAVFIFIALLYSNRYATPYVPWVIKGVFDYIFNKAILLILLMILIYFVSFIFFKTEKEKMQEDNFDEKEIFHYSIFSLVLLLLANFYLFGGVAYDYLVRNTPYRLEDLEGLGALVYSLVAFISFMAVYTISIYNTIMIRKTVYGRKSLRVLGITAVLLLVSILTLVFVGAFS